MICEITHEEVPLATGIIRRVIAFCDPSADILSARVTW